ncbi:MAG: xylulokinase [Candidatus Nanopelagicales bacterium]
MALVAGVDSSTQSVKVVVRDADSGALIRESRAPHPEGTSVDPREWWTALNTALDGMLDDVSAIAVAGQQHGMVALDAAGEPVRDALLWNDTRSAGAADDLVREWGGPHAWADAVGSVPVAAFTVSKARWLAQHEPENAARAESMMLPHDYLTWRLAGCPEVATTDRGDVSGTGYWSPATGEYRGDLFELAFGRRLRLPRVAAPAEIVGETASGIAIAPGTGDNMGAALALELAPGDVVVSLGTSGTAFACSSVPSADASGAVAGFADATGRFLPLVCTLNAARILTSTAAMLGVGVDKLAELALSAPPGSGGLVLLPYFDGERTPNLPEATGSLHGITRANYTPANIARSAYEGMLCGLADAVDALVHVGVTPGRIMLVGGAAANMAVARIATTLFDAPIEIPTPGEYVADGAARQAAWAFSGASAAPAWGLGASGSCFEPARVSAVRDAYSAARDLVAQ